MPERLRVVEPAIHRTKPTHVELAALHAAMLHGGHQPGRLEDAQVLEDGRQRHVERLGQLADRRPAAGQPRQHGAARRVGERAKHRVQPGFLIHNQLVNYYKKPGLLSRDGSHEPDPPYGRQDAAASLPRRESSGSNASMSPSDVRKFTMQARSANRPPTSALDRNASPLFSTRVSSS